VVRRRIGLIAGSAAVASLVFAAGPRTTFDEAWVEPTLATDIDAYLGSVEAGVPDLRPGDDREVVWLDPTRTERTPISLVYLHGFSADRHEIEPVVSELASDFGANVYFSRLTGHGRDGPAMAEATVEAWLSDTAEAVVIGERIGEHVILVGTSTGGTLALWAAARPEAAERIDALVLISPNFQPKDRSSRILLYPWGSTLARAIIGPERCFTPENDAQERHWTTCYPTGALPPMMALVEHMRTADLTGVKAPVLLVYSPDDEVVDAAETERVLMRLTGTEVRRYVVEGSTDPMRHVVAGDIVSPASNAEVRSAVRDFLTDVFPPNPR